MEEIPEREIQAPDTAGRLDLKAALEKLGEDQRTALLLQQEGYELAEISQALDVPVGTLKSRIFRAKKILRAILEEEQ